MALAEAVRNRQYVQKMRRSMRAADDRGELSVVVSCRDLERVLDIAEKCVGLSPHLRVVKTP
jgi:hypothetical protein